MSLSSKCANCAGVLALGATLAFTYLLYRQGSLRRNELLFRETQQLLKQKGLMNQQLLDANKPVDEIFEGPALSNGFIDNDELAQASLRKTLYTSDVINLIMEIPGVKSVKDFVLNLVLWLLIPLIILIQLSK